MGSKTPALRVFGGSSGTLNSEATFPLVVPGIILLIAGRTLGWATCPVSSAHATKPINENTGRCFTRCNLNGMLNEQKQWMIKHSAIKAALSFPTNPNCTQRDLLSDELPIRGHPGGFEQAV